MGTRRRGGHRPQGRRDGEGKGSWPGWGLLFHEAGHGPVSDLWQRRPDLWEPRSPYLQEGDGHELAASAHPGRYSRSLTTSGPLLSALTCAVVQEALWPRAAGGRPRSRVHWASSSASGPCHVTLHRPLSRHLWATRPQGDPDVTTSASRGWTCIGGFAAGGTAPAAW